jgi:hypothetical protein
LPKNNVVSLEDINKKTIIRISNNVFGETLKIILAKNNILKEDSLEQNIEIDFQILETSNINLNISNSFFIMENIDISIPSEIISIEEVMKKL